MAQSYSLFETGLTALSLGKNSDLILHMSDLHLLVLYFESFQHTDSDHYLALVNQLIVSN